MDIMKAESFAPEPQQSPTPLLADYRQLRQRTEALIASLEPEDLVVQSMPDASPAKWHLAHTTWFFETFLLAEQVSDYDAFDPAFNFLFNSYYEAIGPRQPRPRRGLLTRPSIGRVLAYRRHVDGHMATLLRRGVSPAVEALVRLGIAHEEQHQELLLMDGLHLFAQSPLRPVFSAELGAIAGGRCGRFQTFAGGPVSIGAAHAAAFAFDNEGPRHTRWLQPFAISDRLVTNGEWLAFMADGGYAQADLWLSDGWDRVCAESWEAPLYWFRDGDDWQQMTLAGVQPVAPDVAVTHISYYEAAAFARWADARLPTEAEWEHAACAGALEQIDDVAWQWTQSAYGPYPGFRAATSAIGEYNGKFMVGQQVLRGGSHATPTGHTRLTYRNFFRPEQRWMFSGLRLARDVAAVAMVERDGAHEADAAHETGAERAEFAADVIAGLASPRKQIAPKYFYDAAGSELFEAICRTPEYYPTRTETALLRRIAPEIAAGMPADCALVEFGSGASDKTRLLLDCVPQLGVYVPIDISADALQKSAASLARSYPRLQIAPLVADMTAAVALPAAARGRAKVGFFPGSTIGNFSRGEAVQFLRSARRLLGEDALFIVGADMVKDEATLTAAYNDADGVTACFNRNLLERINRELGADFDPQAFSHLALWNAARQRMEMYLVSLVDQQVHLAGHVFSFRRGEALHTENSQKYTVESIAALVADAGWMVERSWISATPQFAVFALRPN